MAEGAGERVEVGSIPPVPPPSTTSILVRLLFALGLLGLGITAVVALAWSRTGSIRLDRLDGGFDISRTDVALGWLHATAALALCGFISNRLVRLRWLGAGSALAYAAAIGLAHFDRLPLHEFTAALVLPTAVAATVVGLVGAIAPARRYWGPDQGLDRRPPAQVRREVGGQIASFLGATVLDPPGAPEGRITSQVSKARRTPDEAPARDDLAICLSGGGMRSASFNLGTLQALDAQPPDGSSVLASARYLSTVSGGGYIGAGFALSAHRDRLDTKARDRARADATRAGRNPATIVEPELRQYGPNRPLELQLRRRTTYLIRFLRGAWPTLVRVLHGLLVNLLVAVLTVFVLAWPLSGIAKQHDGVQLHISPSPWWWQTAIGLIVVSFVVGITFLMIQAEDKGRAVLRWTVRAFDLALVILGGVGLLEALDLIPADHDGPAGSSLGIGAATITAAVVGLSQLYQARAASQRDLPAGVSKAKEALKRVAMTLAITIAVPAAFLAITVGSIAAGADRCLPSKTLDATVTRAAKGLATARGTATGEAKDLLDAAEQAVADRTASCLDRSQAVLRQEDREQRDRRATIARDARRAGDAPVYPPGSEPLFDEYSSVTRFQVWVTALLLLLFVWWSADVDRWSLHRSYRDALEWAFLLPREGTMAAAVPESVPLQDLAGERPELLVNAVANLSELDGIRRSPQWEPPHWVPPGRSCVPWVFSPTKVGSPDLGWFPLGGESVPGRHLDGPHELGRYLGSKLTVSAAVAVSAAAVSPTMGKATKRRFTALLAVTNTRLGIWFPNPTRASTCTRAWYPSPLYLVREMVGSHRLSHRFVYLTDGGHYDNLGLVEVLRRRSRGVVAFDAAGDHASTFRTLAESVALARADHGIEVDIDPSVLAAPAEVEDDETPVLCPRNHCVGLVRYPTPTPSAPELGSTTTTLEPTPTEAEVERATQAEREAAEATATAQARDAAAKGGPLPGDPAVGWIVYAKASVTADAPWDVLSYNERFAAFPYHSTADQLYDDARFEAYRALGRHVGEEVARTLAFIRSGTIPAGVATPAGLPAADDPDPAHTRATLLHDHPHLLDPAPVPEAPDELVVHLGPPSGWRSRWGQLRERIRG